MSPADEQHARTPLLAVVGATASGKSDLGVALAQRLGGEIVNADSMQLYRGLDIGTAKLTHDERAGIAHHLLDVWEVREPANVADYQRMARDEVEDITGRGSVAVLVGGSGLYVRAAVDDLDIPGTDVAVRSRLEAELAEVGPGVLHQRLVERDPAAASRILASNGRRIVRALEVLEITGGPFVASLPEPSYLRPTLTLGLQLDRACLDERIEARVDRMWELGLVEEARGLERAGLREGRTASRALGYAQVLRHLDGDWTQERARDETVRATRRFARRQESWFRRDPRIHWLDAALPLDVLVETCLHHLGEQRIS